MSLSSQNLEVIRRVTSLLSLSKSMQFCNEQIRTQPLFSPPCANATYGSARMCRRKNVCFFFFFFPPASLLFLPSTREGRGGGRGKDNRSSADVTSDYAGCVALGTQSLAPLLSCVCVCVFSVSPILLFPKEGVLWTKHTRNVRVTVPGNWIITLQSPWRL